MRERGDEELLAWISRIRGSTSSRRGPTRFQGGHGGAVRRRISRVSVGTTVERRWKHRRGGSEARRSIYGEEVRRRATTGGDRKGEAAAAVRGRRGVRQASGRWELEFEWTAQIWR